MLSLTCRRSMPLLLTSLTVMLAALRWQSQRLCDVKAFIGGVVGGY